MSNMSKTILGFLLVSSLVKAGSLTVTAATATPTTKNCTSFNQLISSLTQDAASAKTKSDQQIASLLEMAAKDPRALGDAIEILRETYAETAFNIQSAFAQTIRTITATTGCPNSSATAETVY